MKHSFPETFIQSLIFQEFLQDESILKVGVGSVQDSNYLAADYGLNVSILYHVFINTLLTNLGRLEALV